MKEYAHAMEITSRYVVPMLLLTGATAAFFPLRASLKRSRPRTLAAQVALEVACAAPLVVSGTLHFLQPQAFTPLLSPTIPYREWIVVLTGIPEWAGAAGLFVPGTRRAASLWLAVFMIAIFPANIYVAGQNVHGLHMPSVPVRWTMQAVYIWLILLTGDGQQRVDGGQPAAGRGLDHWVTNVFGDGTRQPIE